MSNKKWVLLLVLLLVVSGIAVMRYPRSSRDFPDRGNPLSLLPTDGSAVVFLDFQQLRRSPFLVQLLSWAPQPKLDNDYKQFVAATGFDYERDLDRVALAINRQAQSSTIFAIVEGRFDRKRISAYASQFGALKTADGKTLFAVPLGNAERGKAYFVFLRDDRIAWANDSSYFFQRPRSGTPQEWREHFSRVAGTPIFAVLRQDPITAAALAEAPGGFHSPQLATLLSQLQWITISGKPDGNLLRVVLDGESLSEPTVRQLKELLSGLVVLAQMGLHDAKMRKELDPELREGYLELLQSAEIEQLDRTSSKSVRVVFEVAPKVLQAPPKGPPAADPQVNKSNPPAVPRKKKK